jgi:hypothetical protein
MTQKQAPAFQQAQTQTAALGLLFGLLSVIEIFGAALNREQGRALDVNPQNQGVFSFGTLLNFTMDALQVTVFLLFLLALQGLHQKRGGDLLNRAIQTGIIISTAWRLMASVLGNYTGLFSPGSEADVLANTLELVIYQQWFWTLGLTLLGLAWLARGENLLARLNLAFGLVLLAGALFLAAFSELAGWADMARYIAMPIWASLMGGALLIQLAANRAEI